MKIGEFILVCQYHEIVNFHQIIHEGFKKQGMTLVYGFSFMLLKCLGLNISSNMKQYSMKYEEYA